MTRIPDTTALGALGVVALGAFAMALGVGSVALGPAAVLQALLGDGDATPRAIVQGLRLPRRLPVHDHRVWPRARSRRVVADAIAAYRGHRRCRLGRGRGASVVAGARDAASRHAVLADRRPFVSARAVAVVGGAGPWDH